MSESDQQNDVHEDAVSQTSERVPRELPGHRLSETRERGHLSREEVAHHLRLDVQLIKALEEDDYSRLPSPAYICGYLRSYARLLKLPEDEIVQAYNQGEQIHAALIPESVSIKPHKEIISPALIKTIVIVIITIAVAGGLYYIAEKFDVFNFGSQTSKRSQLPVPIPAEPSKPAESTMSEQAQPDIASTQTANQKPDARTMAATETKAQPATTVIEQLPTPKTTISGTAGNDNVIVPNNANQATAQTPKPAQPPAQANQATTMEQILRLHFLGDSWAEVTDSAGKRLVYQLVEKNVDLNLDGEAPFTVLLGNAPAVEVYYKGKLFDHARYQRGEIAYFRVGAK